MEKNENKSYMNTKKSIPLKNNRPKTSNLNSRTLFNSPSLDNQCDEFILKPKDDLPENALLLVQNPPLLAIRKQATGKARAMSSISPNIRRPKASATGTSTISSNRSKVSNPSKSIKTNTTATLPTPQSTMLKQRPLTSLKRTEFPATKKHEKEIADERNSLAFRDDPVAYFSKRKDGRGHRFIYMTYAQDRSDPNFSPYDLIKVPYPDVKEEYFTMSVNGVTRILASGNTEYMSLEQWSHEKNEYQAIRKLSTFCHFFLWKPFRIWKKFVLHQRYRQIRSKVIQYSPYNNPSFFKFAIEAFQISCEPILNEYWLCFFPQKKYPISEYKELMMTNTEKLQDKYYEFLENFLSFVLECDADIRDPSRVLVKNSDFKENNRYMPRLGELAVLEEKKSIERQRRMKVVHEELVSFAGYLRMMDYHILEELLACALNIWRKADSVISSDMSSVFEIEISFGDDGNVVFSPNFDDFINAIDEAMEKSLTILDQLPRLLMATSIRPHLREVFLNLNELFEEGPSFKSLCDTQVEFKEIKKNILKVMADSFKDALGHSQEFKDFYPIYETGKLWDPKDYLHERGGPSHFFDLLETFNHKTVEGDPLTYDPSTQVIVSFDVIRKDVKRFNEDQVKLSNFRACTVCGALYIDSRNLRTALTPIPVRSLQAIQCSLRDLMFSKVDYLTKIFKFCGSRLKKQPPKLEEFVDFCDFIERMKEMTLYINNEIDFIDEMCSLFEGCGFTAAGNIEHVRNPLHASFQAFKKDQNIALTIKDSLYDKFVSKLEELILEKSIKLEKYHQSFKTFPGSLEEVDVDEMLRAAQAIKEKIDEMAPEIEELIVSQKILKYENNEFNLFHVVSNDALYQENLFSTIKKWNELSHLVNDVPFHEINMTDFTTLLTSVYTNVVQMRKRERNNLLEELHSKVTEITPFINQLEMLSQTRMHRHHWAYLFEECGQPNGYYDQIKIEELISFGILKEKEKIATITSTAQGEEQLEAEFQEINNYWKSVEIPLLDIPEAKTDETILIGPTNEILNKIADTQCTLYKMLQIPYVKGIKENILSLSSALERDASILEEWQIFQKNWLILQPIFSFGSIKSILPQCVNRFGIVKRRWALLIRHCSSSMTLFHVCSFSALLEMIRENNSSLDSILASLHKYLDSKREVVPRFYFLSNNEVITLISTNDFSVFNRHIVKIFMNIHSLDSRQSDATDVRSMTESQNFQRIKIVGLRGKFGDSLQFSKPVSCTGPCESWVNQVIETMRISFRESLALSIKNVENMDLIKWYQESSLNMAVVTLNVLFTNEIQECFNNFENDIHTFSNYQNVLEERIRKVVNYHKETNLKSHEILKFAMILIQLKFLLDQAKILSERSPDVSQQYNWKYSLRSVFDRVKNTISIQYGDFSQEHGYEFYGNPKPYVYCHNSFRTVNNMFSILGVGQHALLTGGDLTGKTHLTKICALYFGRPFFVCSSYTDCTISILTRSIIGAVGSGSWMILKNIDRQNFTNLSFVYETIKDFQEAVKNDSPKFQVNGKETSINKSFKLIMTLNPQNQSSTKIPSQLRLILKPIGFMGPNTSEVIFSIFYSLGFTYSRLLTQNSLNVLKSIERIFNYLQIRSTFIPMLKICNFSFYMKIELLNTSANSFINIVNEPFIAEQYIVARAIYLYFIHQIRKTHTSIFFRILYSHFHIFENSNIFEVKISKPELFNFENLSEKICRSVEKEIEKRGNCLPLSYFQSKVVALFQMLQNYPCVIITGDPNSGKSLVVELLNIAINDLRKELQEEQQNKTARSEDESTNNNDNDNVKLGNYLPLKVFDLYHASDSIDNIFGVAQYQNEGQYYGRLHSCIYEMDNEIGKANRILRFNGPITPYFNSFLIESIKEKACKTSTFDTLFFDGSIHIIVETSDVSSISPDCLHTCAVLPMRNIQIYRDLAADSLNCEVSNPSLIFSRMKPKLQNMFTHEVVEKMEEIFNEIAPSVVSFVYRLKNQVFSIESPVRMNGGAVIMSDHLPFLSLKYSIYYIREKSCNVDDEKQLRSSFAFAFFTVFCGILEPTTISTFDSWIRASFQINVPLDWVGYDVSEHFWDAFPRPCLHAMYHQDGSLVPLDYKTLSNEPFITPSERSKDVVLLKDINVLTASFLPLLKEASILTKYKENLLIYGPKVSGKSNFLNFLLKDMDDVVPVFIPITPLSNSNTVLQFLANHSPIIKKDYFMSKTDKTYALIFDNVESSNTEALEFIRMIATTNTIPYVSKNDPKVIEYVQLHNFFLIVITEDIRLLPSRFISRFTPIQIPEPTTNTLTYIFKQIASFYKINNELIENILQLFYDMKIKNFNLLRYLELFIHIQERTASSDNEMELCIRAILSEFNLFMYHKINHVGKEDFKMYFLSKFSSDNAHKYFEQFIHHEVYTIPEINYNSDNSLDVNIHPQKDNLIAEELMFHYSSFNVKNNDKIILQFFPYVINHYALLQRAMCYPSSTVFLIGKTGSGKKSLSRFISAMKNYEFFELPEFDENKDSIKKIFSTLITKTVNSKKPITVFLRLTDKNQETFKIVENLFQTYNFSTFFNDAELLNLYQSSMKVATTDTQLKLVIHSKIKDLLMMKLRFIISVDKKFDTTKYMNAYSIFFDLSNSADLEEAATSAISRIQSVERYPSLNIVFAKIYSEIAPKFTRVCSNQYIDFLNVFNVFIRTEKLNNDSRHENNKLALDYLSMIQEKKVEIQKKLEDLEPKYEEMKKSKDDKMKEFEEQKVAVSARLKKIEENEQDQMDEIDNLNDDLDELNSEVQQCLVEATKSFIQVNKLKEADIQKIQSFAENPPNGLKKLISLICIFLDLSPDYTISGKEFLRNKNFFTILKQINPNNISDKAVEASSRFTRENTINKEELKSVSIGTFNIYLWIMDVNRYAQHSYELKQTKLKINKLNAELDDYRHETQNERDSINHLKETINSEMEVALSSYEDMKTKGDEVQNLKSDLEIATQILDNLDDFTEKLKIQTNEFSESQSKVIGNSVLFASFVAYCGSLEQKNRIGFLDEVTKLLESVNIPCTKENPLLMVTSKLSLMDNSRKSLKIDRFLSQDTQTDCRLIMQSVRTPLVIDIDGLVTSFLISRIKESKLSRVSLLSDDFEKVLIEAMTTGKHLLVDDVNYLHPLLEDVLPLELLSNSTSGNDVNEDVNKKIRVGNNVVTKHPKFKMYLFTSERAQRTLPENLLYRVNMIKTVFNSSINLMIFSKIFEIFYPDKRYVPSNKNNLESKIERFRLEMDLIDFMAEMENNNRMYDDYVFTEDDLLNDMLGTKTNYLSFVQMDNKGNPNNNFQNSKKEEYEFLPFVQTSRDFWYTISRYLPKIGIKQHFSLTTFLQCVYRAIETSVNDTGELQNRLISYVFRQFCSSLLLNESIIAMFVSSFFMKVRDGKCKNSDLKLIAKHCISEMNDVVDQNIYDSLSGDPVDQLKFANITNVFYYMTKQISDYFGNFERFILPFKYENFVSNDPLVVTLIHTTSNSDCCDALVSIIQSRSREFSHHYHLLFDDDLHLENIKRAVLDAMENGLVCALFYDKPSIKCAKLILQIINQISIKPPSADFRLIIVAENLSLLPNEVLNTKCFAYSAFPSVRIQMQEAYAQLGQNVRSYMKSLPIKKITFMTSLLISAFNFRSLLAPVGFIHLKFISTTIIKDVIMALKTLLDMKTNEIPFKSIVKYFEQSVFGREAVDLFDSQKVENMIHFMICPEILIPNFNFTYRDCWRIPDDISNFDQLPIFSTVDLLLMEEKFGTPLRNWNTSRIIARLFQKLQKEPEIDLEGNKSQLMSLLVSLPSPISTSDETKFSSPISLFILSEIERFNNCISEVKRSIITLDVDVYIAIKKETIPKKWRELCGYSGVTNFTKFVTYLKDKSSFLTNWIKNNKMTKQIDVRFIWNIKGLFMAFLNEESLNAQLPINELEYSYSTMTVEEEMNDLRGINLEKNRSNAKFINSVSGRSLVLTNISLMCGFYDSEKRVFTENKVKSLAFSKMPPLVCKVIQKMDLQLNSKESENADKLFTKSFLSNEDSCVVISDPYNGNSIDQSLYKCPLFKSIPSEEFALEEDFTRIDGEMENFIQYIYLPTNEPQWRHIANGTALVCHITDKFS